MEYSVPTIKKGTLLQSHNYVKINLNCGYMNRRKYPIEYELDPKALEKGTQWLILLLENVGDDILHNLDIKVHSSDSLQISFRSPSDYIYRLMPGEDKISENR
jgi:hypothetical protein